MSAIYNDSLNEYCRKYFVKDEVKITQQDVLLAEWRYKKLQAELFESFLLNEKVNLKVYGENIPLVFLINNLGLQNVEKLLERDALSFTLWTPMIVQMVDNIEGVVPIAAGRVNSAVHSDPVESIKSGFNWMRNGINEKTKKMLTNKVRDLYVLPQDNLEHDASALTLSAFHSNKTSLIGFNSEGLDIHKLNKEQKTKITECASTILEHKFLISQNLVSNDVSKFSRLYSDSINKIVKSEVKDFSAKIFELECFPDLYTLGMNIENPLQHMIKIRHSKNSVKFRSWVQEFSNTTDISEISKAYMDEITRPIGFLQSDEGRFVKSCLMTTIGAGVGAFCGPAGALVGAGAGLAIDLIDEFFISELTKGWTPRMFFDDMRNFAKTI
ncbi:TPA: hypothetical protein N0X38_003014 [Acinetobacter baumannii]|nr:hypothetical protein [Acinetobacter baumannii]HCK7400743.1 hypothetical protein [Acinetobacter baumannii]